MNGRFKALFKGGVAGLAAVWLIAAPQVVSAQWYEDEEAFAYGEEEGAFTDYGAYDDYGEGGFGDGFAQEDMGGNELYGRDAYDGYGYGYEGDSAYYEEEFEDEGEWGDWF